MTETPEAFLYIEHPAPGETIPAGETTIRGWLVGKPGAHFVDLRVRSGTSIFPGILGHPREDLAAHFRARAPRLFAGFEAPVRLAPGANTVTLEACDLAGRWAVIQILDIAAGPKQEARSAGQQNAAPTLRNVEFARALLVLLKSHAADPSRSIEDAAAVLAEGLPHPALTRFAPSPLHGHFDEPAAVARGIFGRINVIGWLFHEIVPIRNVWATFDLQAFQLLENRGEFEGIPERFPRIANAHNCHWRGCVDSPSQIPKPPCLRLYAELEDGGWHLANVQRSLVTDSEHEKLLFPRYAFGAFARAARALRAALASRGVPVAQGVFLSKEVRTAFAEFRAAAPRRGPPPRRSPPLSFAITPSRPPRRVLLVSHNLSLEGAPFFLLEYAEFLVRKGGCRVSLVSSRDGPLNERFSRLGIDIRIVDTQPLLKARSSGTLRAAVRRLAVAVEFDSADLVIANTLASYWAVIAATAARKPSLLYIHESTTPAAFFHGHMALATLGAIESALRQATCVSFSTNATRRYYDHLSDGGNYAITPGWIDLLSIDQEQAAGDRAGMRRNLGIADDQLLVVNIGSMCDRKGQMVFARAVDWMRRSSPDLAARTRFLMVGGRDTTYDRDVAAFVKTLGTLNIEIVPETADTGRYNASADLFVCTSYEESFPRVILEAMGFGCPIVSTSVHGIPEIVRDGEDAILVPAGDTLALANAMERVLSDRALAAGLARSARARLETTFTAERVMPRHFQLACAVAAAKA